MGRNIHSKQREIESIKFQIKRITRQINDARKEGDKVKIMQLQNEKVKLGRQIDKIQEE